VDSPTVEIKTNRTTAREARRGRMANPFDSTVQLEVGPSRGATTRAARHATWSCSAGWRAAS
jgi:hypothetical protein